MVSDTSLSLTFIRVLEAFIIDSRRSLKEGGYWLLAIKGAEPWRCHSELPGFETMGDDYESAQ